MKYLTDDEMLELAKQDRPISREELGIRNNGRNDGFYIADESICTIPKFLKHLLKLENKEE